jgi:hypothetical protein
MAWVSGWVLVPHDDVQLVVDDEVEWLGYPSVGFKDGEVEGSDLNRLWELVRGCPAGESVWGGMLRDGPDGAEKVAWVRREAVEAFAALPESRIRDLVAAWQQAESAGGSLRWWNPEDIAESIRALKFLARQALRTRWALLMVWSC